MSGPVPAATVGEAAAAKPRVPLVAVILAHDEAENIPRALHSVAGLCPIVVVDSGSRDDTVEICRRHGALVLEHPYLNHASQWLWALQHLPFDADWVFALDADFEVTTELRRRLEAELATVPADVGGIFVRHRYVFGGNDIRYGGTKHLWLRLIRPGRARPDLGDLVDFRFVVDGRTLIWPEVVREYNVLDEDASIWIGKQDKFSLRLAVEEELRRRHLHGWHGTPRLFGNPDERIMWLRDLWLRLPLFVRPWIYFFYRYVLFGGFFDGRGGFLYHFQQGLWMRCVVDWKLWQLRRAALDDGALLRLRDLMLQTRSGSVREVLRTLRAEASAVAEGGR